MSQRHRFHLLLVALSIPSVTDVSLHQQAHVGIGSCNLHAPAQVEHQRICDEVKLFSGLPKFTALKLMNESSQALPPCSNCEKWHVAWHQAACNRTGMNQSLETPVSQTQLTKSPRLNRKRMNLKSPSQHVAQQPILPVQDCSWPSPECKISDAFAGLLHADTIMYHWIDGWIPQDFSQSVKLPYNVALYQIVSTEFTTHVYKKQT